MALACTVGADAQGAPGEPGLLGGWSIVFAELGGTRLPQLEGARTTFSGDGRRTLALGPGDVERGTYELVGGEPRGIDTTTEGRSAKPKGIYRLAGDELTMVFAQNGGPRPEEFSTRGGSDHLLLRMQRSPGASSPRAKRQRGVLSSEPGSRSFRMGITGFPHDMTAEAAAATRRFAHENADIIAHHIEGVPWSAMHRGEGLPARFLQEMVGKQAMTPPGGQVYLAISPGRGALKPHDKAPEIPSTLRGKHYDHELVRQAYLRYCREMVELFDPDHLAIGIEVNEIYGAVSKREWRAYLTLHEHVYRALKRDYPDLPIFASLTLHTLYNQQGGMLEAMGDLMPYSDLIGISYYPFFVADDARLRALDWFVERFDAYEKTYAMVETNAAAETTTFDSYTVLGTPLRQLQYHRYLFRFAEQHDFAFLIAFIHRDYDPLWEKIKASAPELFKAWMNCGLLDEDGKPRLSYRLWRRYFGLDLG